jgi:cobalt-zinc-cadmium efflux system outer membrane protein
MRLMSLCIIGEMKSQALLLTVFLLIYGCAAFHKQALLPAETAADFEARTLGTKELRKFIESNLQTMITPWPPRVWDFRMLTLVAFYYHPDLDVARAGWEIKEAEVITAGERPNPSAGFTPWYHANPGGRPPWTLTFSLDIPVETAGKRGYRIHKAGYLSEAARLNIAVTEWQVRSRLRKRLLDLYATTNKERFLTDQLAIQEDVVRLFEARLTLGESSRFEATQSRLNLDKTRLILSETQMQKAEARAALAEALGLQINAPDGIRISFDLFEKAPAPVSLQEIRRQTLLNRPDILAALSKYEASQSALQLEIARQYPDINLGPGYEWDQGDNKWSLGFSVELPVFNRNQGHIEEAKARRKESAARFKALQAKVIGEIDRSQTAYSEALKKLQAADSLVSTEGGHMRAVQSRFDSGEADRLELEEARLEFSSAGLSYFDAFVSAHENLGILEDAVQRPLTPLESLPPLPEANPRWK